MICCYEVSSLLAWPTRVRPQTNVGQVLYFVLGSEVVDDLDLVWREKKTESVEPWEAALHRIASRCAATSWW